MCTVHTARRSRDPSDGAKTARHECMYECKKINKFTPIADVRICCFPLHDDEEKKITIKSVRHTIHMQN